MSARRIFWTSFLVVAVVGVALAIVAVASHLWNPNAVGVQMLGMGAVLALGFVPYIILAILLADLAARDRDVRKWAAGYAGTVLGTMPGWVVLGWFYPQHGGDVLWTANAVLSGPVLAAPAAGLVYLVVGGIYKARRPKVPTIATPEWGGPAGWM
jgi:hypothetical protein